MPLVTVKTNVAGEKVPAEIHASLTEIVSKVLEKPTEMIFVEVYSGCQMTLNASFDPMAIIKVECVGRLKPKINLELSKQLGEYFVGNLGISKTRMVFGFTSPPARFVVFNGSLMDPMFEYDEDKE